MKKTIITLGVLMAVSFQASALTLCEVARGREDCKVRGTEKEDGKVKGTEKEEEKFWAFYDAVET